MENIIEDQFEIKCSDDQEINKKRIEIRKSAYQGLIRNSDGTHNIEHKKNEIPRYGEYINTYNGVLMRITEVLEIRDHKGVFVNEKNRTCVSSVFAQSIIFKL